jgi:hypothetical protein
MDCHAHLKQFEILDVLRALYREHADAHPQRRECHCPHWREARALLKAIEG